MPEVEYSARNLSPTGRRSLTGVDYANNQNQWAEHNRIRQQEAMLALEQMRQQGENQRQGTFQDRTGFQSQQADLGRRHDLTLQGSFQDRSGAAMDMARMSPGYMRESRAQQEWESDAPTRQIVNDLKSGVLRQAAGQFGIPGASGQPGAAPGMGGGGSMPPEILQAIALSAIGGGALGSSVLQSKAQADARAMDKEDQAQQMRMQLAMQAIQSNDPRAREAGMTMLSTTDAFNEVLSAPDENGNFGAGMDVLGAAFSGKTGLDDMQFRQGRLDAFLASPQVAQSLAAVKKAIGDNNLYMTDSNFSQAKAAADRVFQQAQAAGLSEQEIMELREQIAQMLEQVDTRGLGTFGNIPFLRMFNDDGDAGQAIRGRILQ